MGPEVVRIKRFVEQWQAESPGHGFTGEYWDSLAGTSGKGGQVPLMRHALDKSGLAAGY